MAGDRILFFGRNTSMMALVDQQLKATGLNAHGFLDEELLNAELEKGDVRLLVVGAGVEDEARERLRHRCSAQEVPVLEHTGGPAQLVEKVDQLLGRG